MTTTTHAMIEAAAAAIANARGSRRGVPAVSNILPMLARVLPKLHAEVMEDAEAALRAAGAVSPGSECAWDDATRIAINTEAEARIAALEASLPFAVSRHLSTICSHLLGLHDASADPKVRELAVAIRACTAEAGEAFGDALAAEAARVAALPDGAILRVTIAVCSETSSARLKFAPQTPFEAGLAAVDAALKALQLQRDESMKCPARRGGPAAVAVREDAECRCVGTLGPNPECGACGGSGCVAGDADPIAGDA
ncbi:MAG: hypothetical protein AB1431_08895 [Pseudomonadota bacterium]